MSRVEIKQRDYVISADAVIEKEVKKFGKEGAHIIVPKTWMGKKVLVVLTSIKDVLVDATGNAMSAWGISQKKGRKAAEEYLKKKVVK